MLSRVIGALGPLLIEMNRNALNISIFRIGPLEDLFKSGPFPACEKPPNCSQSLAANLPKRFFEYGPFYSSSARIRVQDKVEEMP